MARPPPSIMAMAMTQAKTGRSRKNRESMAVAYFFGRRGPGLGGGALGGPPWGRTGRP